MIPRVVAITLAAALALFLALWLRKPSAEGPLRAQAPPAQAPTDASAPRAGSAEAAPGTGTLPSTTPAPALHGLRLLAREEAEKRGWSAPVKVPTPAETASERAWRKWKETPISINCTDTPLVEFLEDLRARYGLETRVDPEIDLEAHTVTFRVEDLPGDQAFDLILKMADLAWCIDDRGTLWITTKERVPILAPLPADAESPDDAWKASTVRSGFGAEDQPPMVEQRAAFMKGKTVSVSIANRPLKEAVEELARAGDISLYWSEAADERAARAPIASLVGDELPLWPSIEQLLTPAGLDLACWSSGCATVETREDVQALVRWEVDAEKILKEVAREKAELVARKVRIEGKVLTLQAVAAQLEAQLGVKVHIVRALEHCEVTWESDGLEQAASVVLEILARDTPLAWDWIFQGTWQEPVDGPREIWLVDRR